MSKGTLTLTNNSATVTGSGTTFTSELTVDDFIVVTVGGIPYTLAVKTVNSNTSLTLVSSYTGPTQAGAAWYAVPRIAMNLVTAALVAQSAEALRGLNYDKQNWQQVYSASGNITVKLPDGTTFPGPSWKYLPDNMATKIGGAVPVNQGGTGSTTASDARTNLGLGNSATKNVGTTAGTVAAGDDSRFGTVNGNSGGVITGAVSIDGQNLNLRSANPTGGWPFFITFMAGQGNNLPFSRLYGENSGDITISTGVNASVKYFQFNAAGNFNAPGNITCVSLTQTSDADKKDNVRAIENALDKVLALDGVTFNWKDSGMPSAGVIAQKLIDVLPEAVGTVFDEHDQYESVEEVNEKGEVVITNRLVKQRDESKRSYTVEYAGVIALCLQAIKELNDKVESLQSGS